MVHHGIHMNQTKKKVLGTMINCVVLWYTVQHYPTTTTVHRHVTLHLLHFTSSDQTTFQPYYDDSILEEHLMFGSVPPRHVVHQAIQNKDSDGFERQNLVSVVCLG